MIVIRCGRVGEESDAIQSWDRFLDELESLAVELLNNECQTCDVASWPREARDEPALYGIDTGGRHDDRDALQASPRDRGALKTSWQMADRSRRPPRDGSLSRMRISSTSPALSMVPSMTSPISPYVHLGGDGWWESSRV